MQILARARLEKVVRVRELAQRLGVHEMTIRRDLEQLCDQGLLRRIRGGAALPDQVAQETDYAQRAQENVAAKHAIARAALAHVQPGDTVALDASTTALALAQIIPVRQITVVATGLDSAVALAERGVPFLLTGGSFHPIARSLTGGFLAQNISRLKVDVAFLSGKGLSTDHGLSDPYPPEVEAKQALMKAAKQTVALVDHTKIGREALVQICSIDRLDAIITDQPIPDALADACAEASVSVTVAPQNP